MNILHIIDNFRQLTGAVMYINELANEQVRTGNTVTVSAISTYDNSFIKELLEKSKYTYNDIADLDLSTKYDVIHSHKYGSSLIANSLYPTIPIVRTIHSEYPSEKPLVSDRVSKYIAIRPTVREKLINKDNIDSSRIELIYNPVDIEKYSKLALKREEEILDNEKEILLYIGTIDEVRRESILDSYSLAKKNNWQLQVMGHKNASYLDEYSDIEILAPSLDISKYMLRANYAAGVLLGRTTIEAWAMGIPFYIYDIDEDYTISNIELKQPPEKDELINMFEASNVCKDISDIYQESIDNKVAITEKENIALLNLSMAQMNKLTLENYRDLKRVSEWSIVHQQSHL